MDTPIMLQPYKAADDIYVLPSYFPIPGLGILPINAFVLKGREPVLVDTGQPLVSDEFMTALASIIDPADLRWLFLTHVDPDHTGSLARILERASRLRIISTFLALGKMSLSRPFPVERVYLLNPGQSLNIGDRVLSAVKPPTYDAPESTAFFDSKTSAFFSVDSFGALMSEPVENAGEIAPRQLREGLLTWTTVDSPWLHSIDPKLFGLSLDTVRAGAPKIILSSHLPAAFDMAEELLRMLSKAPEQKAFVGPDQQALQSMLKARPAA